MPEDVKCEDVPALIAGRQSLGAGEGQNRGCDYCVHGCGLINTMGLYSRVSAGFLEWRRGEEMWR